ncbi:MAG: hypothetical protein CL930_13450 [Deltaproteobacteria bacterium]|nr:hypothetical protein [Deltaproteobacteria bacterium]|tara:strand:- start:275 stop:1420 length:1146 start_codon:yes stop_codon:yes gene_type:complete
MMSFRSHRFLIFFTLLFCFSGSAHADEYDCPWDRKKKRPKIALKPSGALIVGKTRYSAYMFFNPTGKRHRPAVNKLYKKMSMCVPEWKDKKSPPNPQHLAKVVQNRKSSRAKEARKVESLWKSCIGNQNSATTLSNIQKAAHSRWNRSSEQYENGTVEQRIKQCTQYLHLMRAQSNFDKRDWSMVREQPASGYKLPKSGRALMGDKKGLRAFNAASWAYNQLGWPQMGGARKVGDTAKARAMLSKLTSMKSSINRRNKNAAAKCRQVDAAINTEGNRLAWKKCVDRIRTDARVRNRMVLDPKSGLDIVKQRVKSCNDKVGLTRLQQPFVPNEKAKNKQHGCACGDSDWPLNYKPAERSKTYKIIPCDPYVSDYGQRLYAVP